MRRVGPYRVKSRRLTKIYKTGIFLHIKYLLGLVLPLYGSPIGTELFAKTDLQKSERSAGFHPMAASYWSVVIISTLPLSLAWRWSKYLRVVGILEMVE